MTKVEKGRKKAAQAFQEEAENGGKSSLRYSAPALEKGLDILEFLSEKARSYSLAQLAEEIGRTKGEIFRMLAVLEARGYVEREPDTDDYQVTDRLLRVGLRRPKYRALTETARAVMERFAAETRYPCHLAIASDEQIVVVSRAESPDLVGVTVRVGYRQPLLETGSGRCILAYMDEGQREHVISILKRQHAGIDIDALDAERELIRKKGSIVEESRIMEGVWDISCPILSTGNEEVVAAITTPYVRLVINQMSKDEVAARLREAAQEISEKLSTI
ncbi:MAG: IclR family transcriptional regulator [Parvibaculum sp.]|uniref:IclR family transcriptional regulator n=1 Tax=Parvibaculum sp. TaxID=2024848 RepID=UPI003265BC04